MPISIYLGYVLERDWCTSLEIRWRFIFSGTMDWKWTGDELQASKLFLMTSIIFAVKTNYFKYIIII